MRKHIWIPFLTVLILAVFTSPAAADPFIKVFGGPLDDGARHIAPTDDGGFIVTGYYTYPAEPDTIDQDVWVLRLNAVGDTPWTRTFGTTDALLHELGRCGTETTDGDVVVCGTWASGTDYLHMDQSGDPFVMRLHGDTGALDWRWSWGGDNPEVGGAAAHVVENADGDFVVAGARRAHGFSQKHAFLIQLSPTGRDTLEHLYPAEFDQKTWATCIRQTPADGGYIMSGLNYPPPEPGKARGVSRGYLIKTDAAGDTLWTRVIEKPSCNFEGRHICLTADGGYAITGNRNRAEGEPNEAYIYKTDADGAVQLDRGYSGDLTCAGDAVAQTPDGGYVVAGFDILTGTESRDAFLLKTNAAGDTLWVRHYGFAFGQDYEDRAFSVAVLPDGFIMAGRTTRPGTGGSDVLIIRTDERGVVVGVTEDETPGRPGLAQNHPNPFNPRTTIVFEIASPGPAKLEVFDARGRRVTTLVDAVEEAGRHEVDFRGEGLASGIYYYRLQTARHTETRRMALIR